MKKLWILLFIALGSLTVISCKVRHSEPITGEELSIENERIANGEKIYMAYCQKCHPAGEGGLGPSINANPAPGFIKRFQVRHGLGTMPSFGKEEISNKDVRDMMKYLKSLKQYH